MRTRLRVVLALAALALTAGCYTQLHPPVTAAAVPREAADSTDAVAAVPDSGAMDYESRLLMYGPYYPSYPLYVTQPYDPYYHPRRTRWYAYYNTPWWHRRHYEHRYYPSRSVPAASAPSPAPVRRPGNRGRRVNIAPPPAPAPRSVPEAERKETAAAAVDEPAAATAADTDDGNGEEKTTDEPTRKSNRGRKLDF